MEFDERQLRAFIAIAETGSLGRAARVAHLTQPSLSRLIKGMEDRLGHKLFERETKGMALTAAGTLLLPHARMLVSEMQTARNELDALRGLRRGIVRVGAVAAVLRTLVAEALGALLERTPQLTADIIETVDSELLHALLSRQIDLAITAGMLDSPDVEHLGRCAYTDHYAVFCSAAHPLSQTPPLEDLMACGWVMPGSAFTPRLRFEAMVRACGLSVPHVAAEATSVEVMIAVSANSQLLCWLPEPLVAAHVASGAMRKLSAPALEQQREFQLYRRATGFLPDAAHQFLNHLPLIRHP